MILLPASSLSDGPWCPDEVSDQRWDADLLRVRKIVVDQLGVIDSLVVRNSYFHNTVMGSHLKSRAARTDVEGNRFIDGPKATTVLRSIG